MTAAGSAGQRRSGKGSVSNAVPITLESEVDRTRDS